MYVYKSNFEMSVMVLCNISTSDINSSKLGMDITRVSSESWHNTHDKEGMKLQLIGPSLHYLLWKEIFTSDKLQIEVQQVPSRNIEISCLLLPNAFRNCWLHVGLNELIVVQLKLD